jgi:hypothetical protein
MKRSVFFVIAVSSFIVSACAHKQPPNVYQLEADREGIKKSIQPHLKELRPCYEMAIDAYPGAEGKVLAEFEIADDGSMKDLNFVEFHKSLEGGRICMMDTMKKWTFPKPSSNEVVTVKYPFFFSERLTFQRQ